uniref:BRISC and BRCA1-A complex member 2 n=1 Tax=Echinococcus granulosus TaxID=6210 RepID=A0A068WRM1_ECHGR|nr:hypothetical protein EgrG_000250700 [Echinococcus granulosus]
MKNVNKSRDAIPTDLRCLGQFNQTKKKHNFLIPHTLKDLLDLTRRGGTNAVNTRVFYLNIYPPILEPDVLKFGNKNYCFTEKSGIWTWKPHSSGILGSFLQALLSHRGSEEVKVVLSIEEFNLQEEEMRRVKLSFKSKTHP